MTDKKKKLHVKNTDRVMIIAGKDKGKDQLKKDRVLTNPARSLLTHTQNK